jgi:tRNA nucleotidyltransferase (CCA-adding enzyme)
MDVIVTHANTDFDAFASMLAARRLFPSAVVALSGSLNRNVRELYRLHADELEIADAARLDLGEIRRLIVVETAHPDRLGDFGEVARRDDVDVVVFDHHADSPPSWVAPESFVGSPDGALTTTLVSILAEREIVPTPLEATVFALGIHEDTGSLSYPSTTLRDVEALAWCVGHGARQEAIAHYLHAPLGPDERALLDALLAAAEAHEAGGLEILVAAVRWPAYVDGVSNLAHKIADVTDARALVCLVEMDERVFCVARTRVAELDAAALAGALGGGGHAQAASAVFRGSLRDAKRLVLDSLPGAVRRPVTAGEIMSRPARFVGPDDSVADAMILCQRHRQSGIQVGDPGRLLGVVTREDLDKAVGHGLSHAPVKSVMTADVVTCDEDTPLAELRSLVASSVAGRVPVVRNGAVVGVVTRTDVLGALAGPADAGDDTAADPNIAERLDELDALRDVFAAIQVVGERYEGVYLVGGAVRDLLLGEPGFDVDVAVEGDGIAFGEALAAELGGRAVPHSKFGTAVVVHPGGRVDVATARTEFYDYPAALPTVEQASIRQDLYRRDFTINALAVSLRGPDFGRLVDHFGGRADLEAGIIRVLHNLSFIDDPTRIFRAVRYENRYGFRMEAHTLSLARACVDMNLVGELSSSRLRDELVAILSEENVGDAVVRLHELGLDAAIHPRLAADEEAARLIAEVDAVRELYAPEAPAWRLRLGVLARRLSPSDLLDWAERLKLRRRDAERVADAVTISPRLRQLVAATHEPAEIRRLVEPHDPDGALLALAGVGQDPTCGGRSQLVRYFEDLRTVRLEISGGDLAELGIGESPRVGAILEELLRRKLNGELDGRAAELEAARELVEQA